MKIIQSFKNIINKIDQKRIRDLEKHWSVIRKDENKITDSIEDALKNNLKINNASDETYKTMAENALSVFNPKKQGSFTYWNKLWYFLSNWVIGLIIFLVTTFILFVIFKSF